MLRQKPRSSLQRPNLASSSGFQRYHRADCVTITLQTAKANRNGRRELAQYIFQEPHLRAIAILQKYFLTPIMIKVRKREGAAVFHKIQTDCARNIRESAVAVIRVKDIALVAAPRAIGANQLVDRAPSLFILL